MNLTALLLVVVVVVVVGSDVVVVVVVVVVGHGLEAQATLAYHVESGLERQSLLLHCSQENWGNPYHSSKRQLEEEAVVVLVSTITTSCHY